MSMQSPVHTGFGHAMITKAAKIGTLVGAFILFVLFSTEDGRAGSASYMDIDADDPPADILSPEEVERFAALWDSWTMTFRSDRSPDGNTVLMRAWHESTAEELFFFLDLRNWTIVEVADVLPEITASTWVDDDILGTVVIDDENFELAMIDRRTGKVWSGQIEMTGDFLALSRSGRWVLTLDPMPGERRRTGSPTVPKVRIPLGWNQDSGNVLEVTAAESRLMLHDLHTGEQRVLLELPATSMIPGARFSPDEGQLALVLGHFEFGIPNHVRPGRLVDSLLGLVTQDALGRLAPEDNPFRTNSRLLFFDLDLPGAPPNTLEAVDLPESHEQFNPYHMAWSPSGDRLVVAANEPANLGTVPFPPTTSPRQ